MTLNNKFTFRELDPLHGGTADPVNSLPRKRAYTESQIREIQDAAFAEGVITGERNALTGIEEKVGESLDILHRQHTAMLLDVEHKMEGLRAECAELAFLIAQKLAAALIDSHPSAEIEKLLSSCIPHLNSEPRIVVRVDEEQIHLLKDKIDNLSRQTGYPGRIVIIGEPDSEAAQCQIEWADGGVSYRTPDQLSLIDRLISEYAAASRALAGDAGGATNSASPLNSEANQMVMDEMQ